MPEASKENQDAYDAYVSASLNVIYSEKGTSGIMQMLQAGVGGVANAAVMVARMVDSQQAKRGLATSDEIKALAANEIVGAIIEQGENAGLFKLSPEEKTEAMRQAMELYLSEDIKAGKRTPEQVQQMKQELEAQQSSQPKGMAGGA